MTKEVSSVQKMMTTTKVLHPHPLSMIHDYGVVFVGGAVNRYVDVLVAVVSMDIDM